MKAFLRQGRGNSQTAMNIKYTSDR